MKTYAIIVLLLSYGITKGQATEIPQDTNAFELEDTLIRNSVPLGIWVAIKVNRFQVTKNDDRFVAGCVVRPGDKTIRLDHFMLNKKKNKASITLSFGGKFINTKTYNLKKKGGSWKLISTK